MKLSQLLEKDVLSNAPEALQKSLGDSYLMENNSIFRKVRKAALLAGFHYSSERNDAYLALPLTQLENLLAAKSIPYFDNKSTLHDLESRYPGMVYWDDIMDGLKKNHVFHESCHAVGRKIIESEGIENSANNGVLQILIEESFSNTCELLAVIDAGDTTHRIFFEWNSYICMFEDRSNLKKGQQEFGQEMLFKFMLFSYLHSNFLCDGISEKNFQQILRLLDGAEKFDQQKQKILRSFSKIAFKLNPRFREVTTSLHMRLLGLKEPLRKTLNFNFMEPLESQIKYLRMIEKLSQVIN